MQPNHRNPDYGAFEDQVKLYRREILRKPGMSTGKSCSQSSIHGNTPKGRWLYNAIWWSMAGVVKDMMNGPSQGTTESQSALNMHADWFFLKQELARARKWETVMKINKRSMLQEVQQPLDWLPWKRLSRQLTKPQNVARQTWHQGALFTKSADGQEGKHLCALRLQEDLQEIEMGINLEFWSQGLMQMPKYEISTHRAAVSMVGKDTRKNKVGYACVDIYIYMSAYVYMYMYVYKYVYMYICTYVYMYIWLVWICRQITQSIIFGQF